MKELKLVPAEFYHHMAPKLPEPVIAFGLCFDEHKDILLVYEEEELEAA